MAIKWLFFPKKIARIAQRLGVSPLGPHIRHHVHYVKNIQNIMQMALKWLFFSETNCKNSPAAEGFVP